MALKALIGQNKVDHLITQNTDGLHRKSGIRLENLTELHGNAFVEKCENCSKTYIREHVTAVLDYKPKVDPVPTVVGSISSDDESSQVEFQNINLDQVQREKSKAYGRLTGGKCSENGCDGYLRDYVTFIGESVPSGIHSRAIIEAGNASVLISIGQSFNIEPANTIVNTFLQQNKSLVIINPSQTSYDEKAELVIKAPISSK